MLFCENLAECGLLRLTQVAAVSAGPCACAAPDLHRPFAKNAGTSPAPRRCPPMARRRWTVPPAKTAVNAPRFAKINDRLLWRAREGSPNQPRALELALFSEFTHSEIAQCLEQPVGTGRILDPSRTARPPHDPHRLRPMNPQLEELACLYVLDWLEASDAPPLGCLLQQTPNAPLGGRTRIRARQRIPALANSSRRPAAGANVPA